jgi:putative ABC transport system substrate-binding protein
MNRRRWLLIVLGASAVLPCPSFAQQGRVWRVGFLAARSRSTPSKPDIYYDAFVEAMRELGYVEGKNLVIEWRFADGNYDRFPALASELAALKVDVLVTHVGAGTRALQRATSTIPIVVTSISDPVGGGYAASLARPGGNITGLSNVTIDATSKRFELLTAMLPKLSRVAVLLNPRSPSRDVMLQSVQEVARRTRIKIVPVDASTAQEIDSAFAAMAQQRAQALIIVNDSFFLGQARKLAALTVKNRLPSISPYREIVTTGGLMSYGQNYVDTYRQAAIYVDKILKGAKPGDLPIEQPTRLELIINRNTAKTLGINIPDELILRADKIID